MTAVVVVAVIFERQRPPFIFVVPAAADVADDDAGSDAADNDDDAADDDAGGGGGGGGGGGCGSARGRIMMTTQPKWNRTVRLTSNGDPVPGNQEFYLAPSETLHIIVEQVEKIISLAQGIW